MSRPSKTYRVLGIMSGSSLDGIDIAHIRFKFDGKWHYHFLKTTTVLYTNQWKLMLKKSFSLDNNTLQEFDKEYTTFLASEVNTFIQENSISTLDAICSHGHTVKHEPALGITYQIGNLPFLADLVNQVVVCDFRKQDILFGGEGAPLVPIGDKLLFYDYNCCLNLGGIANISLLEENDVVAFDICAMNIILNKLVQPLGLHFDPNGALAASGKCIEPFLDQLNNLPFYLKQGPKSLSYQWVEKNIFCLIDNFKTFEINDLLHTYCLHAAIQIAKHCRGRKKMLITGGGAHNQFLIEEIKKRGDTMIVSKNKRLIDFKEALIFGLLGVLKLRGENNCLKSVTGATKDHSSGTIHKPSAPSN